MARLRYISLMAASGADISLCVVNCAEMGVEL